MLSDQTETTVQFHPFEPVADGQSHALVLGSFPSVLSRKNLFYYGNPRNRFWGMMGLLLGAEVPGDAAGRRAWLLGQRIALWDVIQSCEVRGSSDRSIRKEAANDIGALLRGSRIQSVFANGALAGRLYRELLPELAAAYPIVVLPSTSPANAAFGMERLLLAWNPLRVALKNQSGE